jgi:hypothetical protein
MAATAGSDVLPEHAAVANECFDMCWLLHSMGMGVALWLCLFHAGSSVGTEQHLWQEISPCCHGTRNIIAMSPHG